MLVLAVSVFGYGVIIVIFFLSEPGQKTGKWSVVKKKIYCPWLKEKTGKA